jgi:hypothetical protein
MVPVCRPPSSSGGERETADDKRGYPADSAGNDAWTRATKWEYEKTNNRIDELGLPPCKTVITFSGNKKSGEKTAGVSCKYL